MDRMDSTFKKIFVSISFWAKNEIRMKMKSKSLSILSIPTVPNSPQHISTKMLL